MDYQLDLDPPGVLQGLQDDSAALGFQLACESAVGALLRTLAASKPGGTLLELGTGTGMGTAWLLDGMSADARLVSVDNDPRVIAVARRHLAADPRVTFHSEDAAALLGRLPHGGLDLIFADAWPGKYSHLDLALRLLRPGGLYIVDDMAPQADWPDDHRRAAERLSAALEKRPDLIVTRINWSSGVIIAARRT